MIHINGIQAERGQVRVEARWQDITSRYGRQDRVYLPDNCYDLPDNCYAEVTVYRPAIVFAMGDVVTVSVSEAGAEIVESMFVVRQVKSTTASPGVFYYSLEGLHNQ